MSTDSTAGLHVLIADERQERLTRLSDIVTESGHRVTGRLTDAAHVTDAIQEFAPDIAIVALGEHREHAVDLVAELVDEAPCAVIVWVERPDPAFVAEAARLGVFGQLTGTDPTELRGAIDIALRRFTEVEGLRGAFERRAFLERAKGILMERHGIDEHEAFSRIRRTARDRRVPVGIVAQSVISGDDPSGKA